MHVLPLGVVLILCSFYSLLLKISGKLSNILNIPQAFLAQTENYPPATAGNIEIAVFFVIIVSSLFK